MEMQRKDANVKSKCCSGVCMGMQWASDCSTTTDPLLSQRFSADTLLVPMRVHERERRAFLHPLMIAVSYMPENDDAYCQMNQESYST